MPFVGRINASKTKAFTEMISPREKPTPHTIQITETSIALGNEIRNSTASKSQFTGRIITNSNTRGNNGHGDKADIPKSSKLKKVRINVASKARRKPARGTLLRRAANHKKRAPLKNDV